MLKPRVYTALVLVALFLAALFLLPWYLFAAVVGLFFTAGAWEWANLAGILSAPLRWVYALTLAVLALAIAWLLDWSGTALRSVLLVACGWWALALLWIQGYPASAAIWGARPIRLAMGALVLIPAWLASIYLHSQASGTWLVLFVVFLVAAADIGAYFSGRAFGRRKLAPNVSPGKSWEGVLGGALLALLVAALFNAQFHWAAWLPLFAVALPTALVSVVGDLLESMLKRQRGVKDSSQLLPGHGGVLDRIDGLVAAVPVFALGVMAAHWNLN